MIRVPLNTPPPEGQVDITDADLWRDVGQFFVDGPEGLLLEVQFRRERPAGG